MAGPRLYRETPPASEMPFHKRAAKALRKIAEAAAAAGAVAAAQPADTIAVSAVPAESNGTGAERSLADVAAAPELFAASVPPTGAGQPGAAPVASTDAAGNGTNAGAAVAGVIPGEQRSRWWRYSQDVFRDRSHGACLLAQTEETACLMCHPPHLCMFNLFGGITGSLPARQRVRMCPSAALQAPTATR